MVKKKNPLRGILGSPGPNPRPDSRTQSPNPMFTPDADVNAMPHCRCRCRGSGRNYAIGFAFGVVRMLIGFARIRSVCESVRISNQFAGEAVYSRAIRTISRSLANPGRIRANLFSLRTHTNCESTTQAISQSGEGKPQIAHCPLLHTKWWTCVHPKS